MRANRLISCFAVVGALVAFGAVPASAADPTVSATPSTDLADGQQISVSASGFAPDTYMAVVECPTTTISPGTCDLSTVQFTYTDGSGAYTFPFTVSRILSDGTDCALNGGCYIGTQDADALGPTASTLITFDPNIPPIPKFEMHVRFDKTPKVNSKGVVGLKGTLKCLNRAANVEIDTDLFQIVDRAIFESYSYVEIACSANTIVPFRITVRPQNGFFGPGDAVVRFQAYSFSDGSYIYGRRALTLVPAPTIAPSTPSVYRGVWK
jgi:hypothetical protein